MSPAPESTLGCPRSLLDKVDEIRKFGLQDRIALPQIAVMGDQSSGKSSLLEYISGVTFPKDKAFCTCFATEVIMRPAAGFSARVLINKQVDCRLKKPKSLQEVGDIIEQAKKLFMQEHDQNTIYEDVLTVELSGPELPMLTLVDLPGYVHTHTGNQPESIVKDIENLVQKYLESSRTIILAVIPANQDFATNVVIQHIRKVDQEGKRTLCVLTKPDSVEVGTEDKVLDILSGKEMRLLRGYHIIKNRNFEQCRFGEPLDVTSKKEASFFSQPPWSLINSEDKGIKSLVEKLTDTLTEQVEKEFPSIKREIVRVKEELEKQLHSLGPAIRTDLDKANLIQRNINQVMKQLKDLVDGNYCAVGFHHKSSLASPKENLRKIGGK